RSPASQAGAAAAPRSLAERLTEAFLTETPRLLGELAEAITARDYARGARIAHNIKGSAFYIQATTMADAAGGLEDACDAVDENAVEIHWAALQDCIREWMDDHASR
ncbi:MAG TPA: Hpt domain-containing protein, partial [Burkholderiaceae bacterium]